MSAPLGAHGHGVFRVLEFPHPHPAHGPPRREQCGLVDEIHQIGAGEAGRAPRDDFQIHIRQERHLTHVDLKDVLAADDVGVCDDDLAVETARPQQRGIEYIRAVGRSDQDDVLVQFEAVHFDQQLIQRLFALVVAAAEARAAPAADRVDFVHEYDAGRVLFCLGEHVPDAGSADADKHLDEVGTRDREERHVRLARDGARQQGLAGTGWTDQQNTVRDPPSQPLKLLRVAQKVDDFLQRLPGLIHARHVLEGHPALGPASAASPSTCQDPSRGLPRRASGS